MLAGGFRIRRGGAHEGLVVKELSCRFTIAETAHLNMLKGRFTSAAVSRENRVSEDRPLTQGCILVRVRVVLSRRHIVTAHSRPSWSRVFGEFRCRECGFQEAYRSRPRGSFEKHVLPFLLLQAVRCERCYHRSYVLLTIPAPERVQTDPKGSQSQRLPDSKPDSRVA